MKLHPLARPFQQGACARRCTLPLVLPLALVFSGCAATYQAAVPSKPTPAMLIATAPLVSSPIVPEPKPAPSAPPAQPVEPPAPPPVAIDPLRPEVRVDLDDRTARTDLWMRVRRGFAVTNLDTGQVREREQWYATRPD